MSYLQGCCFQNGRGVVGFGNKANFGTMPCWVRKPILVRVLETKVVVDEFRLVFINFMLLNLLHDSSHLDCFRLQVSISKYFRFVFCGRDDTRLF